MQVLVASGMKVWPESGGILDQDLTMIADLSKLLSLYADERNAMEKEGRTKKEDSDEDDDDFPDYTALLN